MFGGRFDRSERRGSDVVNWEGEGWPFPFAPSFSFR